MRYLSGPTLVLLLALGGCAGGGSASEATAQDEIETPREPAKIDVTLAAAELPAGGRTEVTLRLEARPGIRINRYPKIKLHVPAQAGLVAEAHGEVGNDHGPSPDAMEANYFDTVDPLSLTLELDPAAPTGEHTIDAQLSYFYCVKASGFCAPARVPIGIPVVVR